MDKELKSTRCRPELRNRERSEVPAAAGQYPIAVGAMRATAAACVERKRKTLGQTPRELRLSLRPCPAVPGTGWAQASGSSATPCRGAAKLAARHTTRASAVRPTGRRPRSGYAQRRRGGKWQVATA